MVCLFVSSIPLKPRGRPLVLPRAAVCGRIPASCLLSPQPFVATPAYDAEMMRRCVALAQRAAGQTRPNPAVGCVVTAPSGVVLGEGYHRRAGHPHAEVEALRAARCAGYDVRGATLYVSLEPCNHRGRTGPCAEALIEAGIGRVVVGVRDPNRKNRKGGIARLREAGIEVVEGVEGERCTELVEGFLRCMEKQTAFGILKYAMTLDGRTATENGSSKWISGEESRAFVQRLREGVDAIVVGGETVRVDNPRLTVRQRAHASDASNDLLSPMRVIMTRSMRLDINARIFDPEAASSVPTIVLTVPGAEKAAIIPELRSRGVVVEEIPDLSPRLAMLYLYERGALNVLWECGGNLAAAAVAEGAVQKIHAFIAPKIVGGDGSLTPLPLGKPALATDMSRAVKLEKVRTQTFGSDILITGYMPT